MKKTMLLLASIGMACVGAACVSGDVYPQGVPAVPCQGDCAIPVTITVDGAGNCSVDDVAPRQVGRNHKPVMTWQLPQGYVFPKKGIEFADPIFVHIGAPPGGRDTFRVLDRNLGPGTRQQFKYMIRAQTVAGKICTPLDPYVYNDGCDVDC